MTHSYRVEKERILPRPIETWLIHMTRDSHNLSSGHSVVARLDMPHLQWAMTHTYHICHDIFTWPVTHSRQMSSRKNNTHSEFFLRDQYVNTSRHNWMSHVKGMRESCHVCMSHVPACDWVTSPHAIESRVCHTCEQVRSHIRMSHVTHVAHVKWVMSHIWMSHVTHMN